MNSLKFGYNWNRKLDCQAFTSLRLSDRFNVGDTIDIYLNKQFLGFAEIIDKKAIFLNQINKFIAYLDSGYSKKECQNILRKMYKNKNVDWSKQKIYLYLIKKVKESL